MEIERVQAFSELQDTVRVTGKVVAKKVSYEDFLSLTGGGKVYSEPMVMHLPNQHRGRSPDVMVLLPETPHLVRKNDVAGAADLVVEVVSEGSQRRDRVEKYGEYERGGVKAYWILDPTRKASLFHVLGEDGLYELRSPNAQGIYWSTVLEKLALPAGIFWRDPLPDAAQIARMVEAMVRDRG